MFHSDSFIYFLKICILIYNICYHTYFLFMLCSSYTHTELTLIIYKSLHLTTHIASTHLTIVIEFLGSQVVLFTLKEN